MNIPHLQLGISDAALMASSDGAYGEVELRPSSKFANPRLSALVAAVHAEMVAGFPSRPRRGLRGFNDARTNGHGPTWSKTVSLAFAALPGSPAIPLVGRLH
jgi:hypothetical protein